MGQAGDFCDSLNEVKGVFALSHENRRTAGLTPVMFLVTLLTMVLFWNYGDSAPCELLAHRRAQAQPHK